jgi:hypothetical protein
MRKADPPALGPPPAGLGPGDRRGRPDKDRHRRGFLPAGAPFPARVTLFHVGARVHGAGGRVRRPSSVCGWPGGYNYRPAWSLRRPSPTCGHACSREDRCGRVRAHRPVVPVHSPVLIKRMHPAHAGVRTSGAPARIRPRPARIPAAPPGRRPHRSSPGERRENGVTAAAAAVKRLSGRSTPDDADRGARRVTELPHRPQQGGLAPVVPQQGHLAAVEAGTAQAGTTARRGAPPDCAAATAASSSSSP